MYTMVSFLKLDIILIQGGTLLEVIAHTHSCRVEIHSRDFSLDIIIQTRELL